MTVDLVKLAAEFPKSAVSWRSQSMTKDGKKAMALAYIDARDVMDRLDGVCGPENWQDCYEFHGTRTICYLSIRIGDEWVTKADGAGDSDVEAEKGAISDALKRAAVKWGIGRYLYAIDTPWVPCESYDKGGKLYWSKWTADPWSCIRSKGQQQPAPPANDLPPAAPAQQMSYADQIQSANTVKSVHEVWERIKFLPEEEMPQAEFDRLYAIYQKRIDALKPMPKTLGDHLDNLKAQEDARNAAPN